MFQKLKSSSIVKNLSILVSGTVLAQLVLIAFQLVLRRVFTPADFGAFAVYMSVVGIFVSITSLRYEQTIILPKSDADGLTLTKLSIFISVILISLFSIVLFFVSNWFLGFIGLSAEYKKWLIILPATLLLYSVHQAINYLLIRLKHFKLSGSNKLVRRSFEGLTQSGFGYVGSSFGLILGDIIGLIVIMFRSIYKLRKIFSIHTEKGNNWITLLFRYKSFPLKSAIPSLMNAVSRLLPIILISRFFSAETTGFFDLARVVLIMPLSLVTVSLNQILTQQFSQKRNAGQSVKKDALGTFSLLLIVASLFVLIIKLFGIELFSLFFGAEWSNSGIFAELLVWAFAMKFLFAPFNACFVAFEKIGLGSIWQVIYFLMILSLFFIPYQNIYQFLQTYIVIEIVAFLLSGLLNFCILHQYEKHLR